MRLIHTSDWHLGRSLHGVDLLEYQAAYLDHLVELVRDRRPAAVLVAGDVYDRAVPPVGAVQLLEESLTRLAELTRVVVISGNHDSATRLGFGSRLMRPEIKLFTRLGQVGQAVEVPDPAGGPGALVYPIPFLDVYAAAEHFGTDETPIARTHEAVFAVAAERIRADLARRGLAEGARPNREEDGEVGLRRRGELGGVNGRTVAGNGRTPAEEQGEAGDGRGRTAAGNNDSTIRGDRPAVVAMAHAFVVGGEGSESERDLTVGGIATVPAGVFAGMDYVALGHLHGPQRIAAPEAQAIRYSGSPLAFSFSEAGHVKSTAVVRLEPNGAEVELVPAPVPRPMSEAQGSLEELESSRFDGVADHWLRVTVTDRSRPEDLVQRIARRFPHALVTRHLPKGLAAAGPGGKVTAASDPTQVVAQFLEFAGGAPPSQNELREIGLALEAVQAAGSAS
ncbi:MAG: exonuclease SbcCD subunit D [Bifidobacteriaceae bacterium]|jgi:exonuclease SbcD|nr:exonuclease SbcCD subunit D [Bifidobacteriaceae bacterium]